MGSTATTYREAVLTRDAGPYPAGLRLTDDPSAPWLRDLDDVEGARVFVDRDRLTTWLGLGYADADDDDFTDIPGVGRATAEALRAGGLLTFADLRAAPADRLDQLAPRARAAIEEWREE